MPRLLLLATTIVIVRSITITSDDHLTSISTTLAGTTVEAGSISIPAASDGGNRSKTDRLLRGGSYSRGGSSYHSGGSSSWSSSSSNYNHNNYNHHNSNSNNYIRNRVSPMRRFWTGLAIAGIGLAIFGLIFGPGAIGICCLPLLCCCGAAGAVGAAAASSIGSPGNHYVNECDNNHNYRPGAGSNNNQFQYRVQETKDEVENMSNATYQQNNGIIQPFSGQYTTKFVDPESGKHHNAAISIFFTPDPRGNGYRINGQGSDIDGNTVIEDGFANHDGRALWIEKNISGDLSLQVLSRGQFNFHQHTFEGTWLANTMLSGPYLSFEAANQVLNSYQSQSNVPIVVATPEPTAPSTQ